MKIFLMSKRGIITYVSLFAVALCMFLVGGDAKEASAPVAQKRVPVYCVDRGDEKICALTFDAAWDDSDTDRLISLLEKHDAKATYFIVGAWADKYPESVKKLADAGHELANHTDTHPHINGLSSQQIAEEIKECDRKIEQLTGKKPTLFRGPYGEYNNTMIETAEAQGHMVIQWDVDSLDWKELSAEEIAERVLSRVCPGSVMLFHNGVKNTPQALEIILPKLKKEGYKIVSASDMIYTENYITDSTGRQIKNK